MFGALLLLVVGVLLSYTRSMREQQEMDQLVFRKALSDAYNTQVKVKDINGNDTTDYGATASYSMIEDRFANVPFNVGRRTYASNYNIFWSNAESPSDLNSYFVNSDTVSTPMKKLTYLRDPDASETPDLELKMTTMDYIAVIAPVMISAIGSYTNWFGSYAGALGWAAKVGQLAYFYSKYDEMEDKLKEVEKRWDFLEDQDDQFSDWGWRVATEDKDAADGIEAGKYYVKEIFPEVYDTTFGADTDYDYKETSSANKSRSSITRSIDVADTVRRNFKLRYDITAPDSSIDLALHTYELLSDQNLNQGLAVQKGYSGYSTQDAGNKSLLRQTWTTKK